jgi:hypothetical protein
LRTPHILKAVTRRGQNPEPRTMRNRKQ